MTLQTAIMYFFFGMAAISLFCFVTVVSLYWKREKREQERLQRTRADIGDITIIFQTMRDIVDQQKTLAREFNEDLDKKMAVVKQLLGQSLSRNEELYERQRALTQELDAASAHLESIQRQLADATGDHPELATRAETHARRPDAPRIRDYAAGDGARRRHEPHADPDEVDGDHARSVVFADVDAEADINHPRAPRQPADPERAREAFRTLLDLSPGAEDSQTAPHENEPPATPRGMTPIQKRVDEYHAAGMTIAEIARELGIGKGEVRLMLSLKQHP